MSDLRQAAQQALDYMKAVGQMDMYPEEWAIVGRLEAALAEPVQCADNDSPWLICKPCAAEGVCKKAEPQEPDSPERRCGGPGCDMKCCQPVQEPVAWSGYDLDGMVEAFSRVIEARYQRANPFQNPIDMDAQMALRILRGFIPAMKAYTAPPQRLPLTSDKDRPDQGATYVEGYGYVDTRAVRAVERAHKIGGEG